MASVTYDHVVKRYTADLTVVKDFNVEIKDKEFMVLVGPSGCGKSTALRMLAGLEAISEGRIMIGERVVNNIAAKDRDIAMVFQSYALYPHMSVYDNMAFPLQMQHMKKPEIDKRVRNASRILGLDNFLKRKPRALSGGQRQRVALGRAIVRSPKVFLLDEPLSNLDAKLRGQTRVELQQLGAANDGAAESDALALAARQGARLALEKVVEPENARRVAHALVDLLLLHVLHLKREGHVVIDRHVRVKGVRLEHHRDVAILGRDVVHDPVADHDLALADRFQAGEHAQRGRLATPGGADQHHELLV